MKKLSMVLLLSISGIFYGNMLNSQDIPLPEHPRPDFQRKQWVNLNGEWDFMFDSLNEGIDKKWYENPDFDKKIIVPFPWGSELSQITNEADIGWYSRQINIPSDWNNERVFLVIGACDWKTEVWIDGHQLGSHQGGYTPFEFDLSNNISTDGNHELVFRVDDSKHDFKLEGKQGYGEAKGIWQTVYLEQRGSISFKHVHFTPDIDNKKVNVKVYLDKIATDNMYIDLKFPNKELNNFTSPVIKKNQESISFEIPVPNQHLWTLEDPYLYEVAISLRDKSVVHDEVNSYFGMRKVSIMDLPGTDYPYVALNNEPVYLQLSLDQAYHPEGFYTYPSDEFMRDEIIRSKKIGLNGNRIHIKVEIPRKLYWADKLGLLIMADVPNFWGEPDPEARKEWEYAMRQMMARDYNHPSIFSWVLFNETWGLFTGKEKNRKYLPETQEWVREMFFEAKKIDKSRPIEDNSPCNYDHVITDLNTWHAYLPGYKWASFLDSVVRNTYPGSGWNYIGDNKQTKVPMFNSECGNVWGYDGSTGDVDFSWDYHIMMNEFRKQPKIAGWLYTEHHDVINEWNGYYKFDRTEKITGFSDFIEGMDLNSMHSLVYLSTGSDLCKSVNSGEIVEVPLYLSTMTKEVPDEHYILDYELSGYNETGKFTQVLMSSVQIPASPWFNGEIKSLSLKMPSDPGLYTLKLLLRDENQYVYHMNFTSFLVKKSPDQKLNENILSFAPDSYSEAKWTLKDWSVLDGLKVNGAGSGHFTYTVSIPENISLETTKNVTLIFEASAKKLNGKDREEAADLDGDYMRGKGIMDPSRNPNSYPMTDSYLYPSIVRVRINGIVAGEFYLEDDPADHRGVLSWHSQRQDNKLREAGSYGYLCKVKIPVELMKVNDDRTVKITFEVDESFPGGLAIYGKSFGRYPVEPVLLFE